MYCINILHLSFWHYSLSYYINICVHCFHDSRLVQPHSRLNFQIFKQGNGKNSQQDLLLASADVSLDQLLNENNRICMNINYLFWNSYFKSGKKIVHHRIVLNIFFEFQKHIDYRRLMSLLYLEL